MTFFSRMFGTGVGAAAEGIGKSVSTVWATIKGDKSARDAQIHEEQVAVLAQFAAEFAGRTPETKWDSFVDGLNRLPRPIITFSIIGIFCFAFVNPLKFTEYMMALQIVPDELWMMWLTILAFWFGGRLVSEDIRKPRITAEQIKLAKEILAQRRVGTGHPEIVAPNPPIATVPGTLPDIPAIDVGEPAVDTMIDDLIRREGGYVNKRTDRGGPTKYGITLGTLAAWRGGPVSAADVQALTKEEAHKIYRDQFYLAPGIHQLPSGVQTHVFDICVNSGPQCAIRMLQGALNNLGAGIAEDGRVGPKTVAACQSVNERALHSTLVAKRLQFYENIVASDPSQGEFINGWRDRARLFLPR